MAVYVDSLVNHGWKRGSSCHLMADSVEELHAFAKRIGCKRQWFQPLSSPHYDLVLSKRELAVHHGAIELDRKGLVELIRRLRGAPAPEGDEK